MKFVRYQAGTQVRYGIWEGTLSRKFQAPFRKFSSYREQTPVFRRPLSCSGGAHQNTLRGFELPGSHRGAEGKNPPVPSHF